MQMATWLFCVFEEYSACLLYLLL